MAIDLGELYGHRRRVGTAPGPGEVGSHRDKPTLKKIFVAYPFCEMSEKRKTVFGSQLSKSIRQVIVTANTLNTRAVFGD